MSIAAVILAAGQGTRMKSDLPKVLHTIDDRPMVSFVVDCVRAVGATNVVVVIGYQADRVRTALDEDGVDFALQEEQLGTGHAVAQAEAALSGFNGSVLVLNGDVPCLRPATLAAFIDYHHENKSLATVLTAKMEDATGYGRVVRALDNSLLRIVEHKDATDEEREIDEINSGLFCFEKDALFDALKRVNTENAQNEYYLPDVIELIRKDGNRVSAYCVEDNREVSGVNNLEELERVRELVRDILS